MHICRSTILIHVSILHFLSMIRGGSAMRSEAAVFEIKPNTDCGVLYIIIVVHDKYWLNTQIIPIPFQRFPSR